MNTAKILVADDVMVLPRVRTSLRGHELLETYTLAQAERLVIEDGIDLFLIGVRFDDSKAMELIKFIRHNKGHANTPILVQGYSHGEHAVILKQTMDVMCSLRIISDYLEIDENGLDAIEQIKRAVEKHLTLSTSRRKSLESG